MIVRSTGAVAFVFGSLLAIVPNQDADATSTGRTQSTRTQQVRPQQARQQVRPQQVRPQARNGQRQRPNANVRQASYSGGLQCVPFARSLSGVQIRGNAHTWWDQASGIYQRGSRPELGSVLSFRSSGSMRLGHVAVVTSVINAREIRIDHANWSRGAVTRGMRVVDVSPDNSWTAVQVGTYGADGTPGRNVYPTNGFIYPREEPAMSYASADSPRTRNAGRTAPATAAPARVIQTAAAAAQTEQASAPWVFRYEELAEATRNGVDPVRGR